MPKKAVNLVSSHHHQTSSESASNRSKIANIGIDLLDLAASAAITRN
ncbi:hypothetical protein [Actibacterium pelagium]|nr:hypothetical protein [Actibacterium pelagium]